MKKLLCVLLSLAILLCMFSACDEDDEPKKLTDCQRARILIHEGRIEKAYTLLLQSDEPEADDLLENFAFLPLSIRHDERRYREFKYNEDGNLLQYTFCIGERVYEEDIYTYYASGKVHTRETKDSYGHKIYTYREDGQYESIKTIEDNGRWHLTVYSYDDAGNKTVAKSTSNMSSEAEYTTYSYDYRGNCTYVHTLFEGSGRKSNSSRYAYNEFNELISEEHTTSNGVTKTLYEYDKNGKLIRREQISAKGLSWVDTYVRNSEGLVTKMTSTNPNGKVSTDTYEYDSKGNEILEVSTDYEGRTYSIAHQYDEAGNMTEYTFNYSTGSQDKLTQTFDAHGNLLVRIYTRTGEPDEYDRFNYVYDEFGRVVDVIHFDTETRMSSHQEYTYDEYGHIVAVQKYDNKGTQRLNYESKMELRYYPNGVPEIIRNNYKDNLYILCFEFLTE